MAEEFEPDSSADPKRNPPNWFQMPSTRSLDDDKIEERRYHDLDQLYPDPPISTDNGVIVRRATLHEFSGAGRILDWVADGDIVLLELGRVVNRDFEFKHIVGELMQFVRDDIGGDILQFQDNHLLILPPGAGVSEGVEQDSE